MTRARSSEVRTLVTAADGQAYLISTHPASRLGLVSTPSRWRASLTRDRSWWLTVESEWAPWPVLRESGYTAVQAQARQGCDVSADGWERLHLAPSGRRRFVEALTKAGFVPRKPGLPCVLIARPDTAAESH